MPILHPMRNTAFIALLAMALLFAQALGFVHGIVHAGWQEGAVHSLIDESLFDYDHDDDHHDEATHADGHPDGVHAHAQHHSCAAYDAATLSAGVHFNFPPPPLLPPTRVLALWQAFASWDAPPDCPFSPRAPPR
jgi:hypothetical protein